jgi:hypothetical protein
VGQFDPEDIMADSEWFQVQTVANGRIASIMMLFKTRKGASVIS